MPAARLLRQHRSYDLKQLWRAPALLRRLSLATLLANVAIVLTGGVVRLTASGLGCPTWPRCTDDSYVTVPENGLHGYVEFGNRMLTFALGAIVLATLLAAWLQRPRRRSLVVLTAAQLLGIAGQAALGGVTVLTGLNPWTVAAHFLLSMVLIYGAFALWWRSGESDQPARPLVAPSLRWLLRAVAATTALTLVLGTVVTGSGPHSGDGDAPRTGLDPAVMSQIHADAVLLLIGLSIGAWFAARAVTAPQPLQRALVLLLVVELAQGAIGLVQYLTALPIVLVSAHMLGACAVWIASVAVLFSARTRSGGKQAVQQGEGVGDCDHTTIRADNGSENLPMGSTNTVVMGEQVIEWEAGVAWEPNAPEAALVATDSSHAALGINPHFDDEDQRCVVLLWRSPCFAELGSPNDEALSGHRLYNKGLASIRAGIVLSSELVARLERQNRVHSRHDPSRFKDLVHYVLPLKECVVEVVACSVSIERYEGSPARAAIQAIEDTARQ